MITKKYYKLVRVSHADSDYFRVTNVDTTAGTLTIGAGGNLGKNLEYSTDGVNWTTADPNAPFSLTVPAGANVYMRGTNSIFQKTINMDANHTVGGNVLSLIDKSNYSTMTTPPPPYSNLFSRLFNGNTHLVSAADMNFGNLVQTSGGFAADMFNGCTALTAAPELPMTTLGNSCYSSMFKNCTSLTAAPELPATTVGGESYSYMFQGCTSLTKAPELPATTLAINCYNSMFQNCTSLNTVKCLAENISAYACTNNWMNGVSATGTFIKSANMSSWTTGTSGIPSGWTVVDA